MNRRPRQLAPAFTLVESVVVVIVIALAVPGLMITVRSTTIDTIDQQRRVASAWLASSVLETVQADAASTDDARGFENIDDSTYLSDPDDGLYARLQPITSPYENLGITYEVSVSNPSDLSGDPAAVDDPGALREIVVTVTFTNQSGRPSSGVFRTVVANL